MHELIQKEVEKYYLDYVNNYTTLEGFASGNGITLKAAEQIVSLGRTINNDNFLDK